ncbi:MAG: chemotaxis protein CheW [Pseudanabaenaceae cyanobacterium]
MGTLVGTRDRYLVLQLTGAELVMLPIGELGEVFNISLLQVVQIPDLPAHVMGVCNWRGEVVWLVDVGAWLGFPPLYQQGFSQITYKVVLLQSGGLGLVVTRVGNILTCTPDQIQPVHFPLSGKLKEVCQGYVLQQGQTLLALDGKQLAGAIGHG